MGQKNTTPQDKEKLCSPPPSATSADTFGNTWCPAGFDPVRDIRSIETFLEDRASPSGSAALMALGVRTRRLEGKSNLSDRSRTKFGDGNG